MAQADLLRLPITSETTTLEEVILLDPERDVLCLRWELLRDFENSVLKAPKGPLVLTSLQQHSGLSWENSERGFKYAVRLSERFWYFSLAGDPNLARHVMFADAVGGYHFARLEVDRLYHKYFDSSRFALMDQLLYSMYLVQSVHVGPPLALRAALGYSPNEWNSTSSVERYCYELELETQRHVSIGTFPTKLAEVRDNAVDLIWSLVAGFKAEAVISLNPLRQMVALAPEGLRASLEGLIAVQKDVAEPIVTWVKANPEAAATVAISLVAFTTDTGREVLDQIGLLMYNVLYSAYSSLTTSNGVARFGEPRYSGVQHFTAFLYSAGKQAATVSVIAKEMFVVSFQELGFKVLGGAGKVVVWTGNAWVWLEKHTTMKNLATLLSSPITHWVFKAGAGMAVYYVAKSQFSNSLAALAAVAAAGLLLSSSGSIISGGIAVAAISKKRKKKKI